MLDPQLTPEQFAELVRILNQPHDPDTLSPRLRAVKAYREMVGGGLKEAIAAVDEIIAGQPKPALLARIPNPPAGMLRLGSPVVGSLYDYDMTLSGEAPIHGLVHDLRADGTILIGWYDGVRVSEYFRDATHLALDLTDATGRAHLATWIRSQALASGVRFVGLDIQALCKAAEFAHMTPTEIDLLARLALRIMGRTP